jgi:arylsulfatase A-like enzyme
MSKMPSNVVLVLNDDMGFSDIGCYGGEIHTPHLDRLAAHGLRFTQFYNTARCSPSRASLLTGLHPHQTGVGILTEDYSPDGYPGNLSKHAVTIAEVLKLHGYRTYMSGKWHVANPASAAPGREALDGGNGPLQRGFDRFYGTLNGAGSYYAPKTLMRDDENVEHEAVMNKDYYYTDAISDHAAECIRDHRKHDADKPFFQYVAYTAPHWPLHAIEGDVAKYYGRFASGWDQLREQRMLRMVELGILPKSWLLSERDPTVPSWEDEVHQEWRARCMEVYAAQLDRMDQGIGRIVSALEETEQLENTLFIFLSDNGGCAERIEAGWGPGLVRSGGAPERTRGGEPVLFGENPDRQPGPENTYQSYGTGWANLSNTPFRLYKHWVHEGGIATPFIVHWPAGLQEQGGLRHTPAQLTDVMSTLLDVTGAAYPEVYNGREIPPCEGRSLLPIFSKDQDRAEPLYWEHEGNAAIRIGKWKLVRKYPGPWELYDMELDRTEQVDLAGEDPDRVQDMADQYEQWARRCGVIPRETMLNIMKK